MNKIEIKKIRYIVPVFISIVFITFFACQALAANKYWVGPMGGVTSTSTNWSLTSGGSGGAGVPGPGDIANFDAGNVNDVIIDANMTVDDFIVDEGYTGIVTIEDGVEVTTGLATTTLPVLEVGSTGRQIATTSIPISSRDLGGAFTFNHTTRATVTSIVLTQTGSINADSAIENFSLYYIEEPSCSVVMPATGTSMFGTSTSFVNNISTTTGSMGVGTSTVCLYIKYDVIATSTEALLGYAIDFQILNSTTDIVVDTGIVSAVSPVNIPGRTIVADDNIANSILSLKMIDPSKDPTVFYLKDNAIWKKEGSNNPIRLTNQNLQVQSLFFTNLTGENGAGAVKMQITISNVDIGSDPNFWSVTRTYNTTATIKAWQGSQQ